MSSDRAVSPVVATILMVAIVVVLSATVALTLTDVVEDAKDTNERPIPVSDNLLANGGFESGYAGAWEDGYNADLAPGDGVIVQHDPASGSHALQLDGSPNFVGQDVSDRIEPGKIYRMCARSKVTDPGGSVYLGVQYYDVENPSGATPIEKAQYEVEWTSYREQCVLTDLNPELPVKSAEVYAYWGSGPGTLYVDDVSLVRVKYLADPQEDTDDQ